MVAKVDLPNDCSVDILRNVIQQRRQHIPLQSFYDNINSDLELQFNLYISKKGNPVFIKPLNLEAFSNNKSESEERKKTLINLYKPKEHQAPYELLRTMRKEHDLLCCPSCGEDGAPGTLDHYLPKDIFPEFSICVANLTPMCNRCQEEKSISYLTGKGRKAYIHPYFDEVNEGFFSVAIQKPYSAPSFELKITRGLQAC